MAKQHKHAPGYPAFPALSSVLPPTFGGLEPCWGGSLLRVPGRRSAHFFSICFLCPDTLTCPCMGYVLSYGLYLWADGLNTSFLMGLAATKHCQVFVLAHVLSRDSNNVRICNM